MGIPGIFGLDFADTITQMGPAIETGVEYLRETFPGLQVNYTYLTSGRHSCRDLLADIPYLLGSWYYGRTQLQASTAKVILSSG